MYNDLRIILHRETRNFIYILFFFFFFDIRSMFTPLTSMVMPMANQGEEGNREDASARSSHHGRGDGSGEEAAGVRDGREARPFFDPKRGQLGANFSGGTGLTRPPGILTGTYIAAITIGPRFRREDRGRHVVGTIMVVKPHLPLPVDDISRLDVATNLQMINIKRTLCLVNLVNQRLLKVENMEKNQHASWTV